MAGQDCLVHANGLGNVLRILVCESEVVVRVERVGVIGTQDTGAVGQDSLVHVDRCLEIPRFGVCGGEVVVRVECVGVVGA